MHDDKFICQRFLQTDFWSDFDHKKNRVIPYDGRKEGVLSNL